MQTRGAANPGRSRFSGGLFGTGKSPRIRYTTALRDTAGNPAHAASFIRRQLILLDEALLAHPAEHARILAHERLHFLWPRLGNPRRLSWEAILQNELARRARGEMGWSAEWRKLKLTPADLTNRTRFWREYCCESFCDTGAWLQTGVESEGTLANRYRMGRKTWFSRHIDILEQDD
jgi:hypothetical protein